VPSFLRNFQSILPVFLSEAGYTPPHSVVPVLGYTALRGACADQVARAGEEEERRERAVINADKPHLWKEDIAASVDLYNDWFIKFAPKTYREKRAEVTELVKEDLRATSDMREFQPLSIRTRPQIISTLRMSTAPPIARDRLIGLAQVRASTVHTLEEGKLPSRVGAAALALEIESIWQVIHKLLDRDLFPWIDPGEIPREQERVRAATIIADRRCGAEADPIIRNAQEQRQLQCIADFLQVRGYKRKGHPGSKPITEMEPGTFAMRLTVMVGKDQSVQLPIDVVIQRKHRPGGKVPIFIEAKSAGDYTNTNKRRKEEATKTRQLQERFGKEDGRLVLFLCGYFNAGYLGYEAAEGIDWIWEHRVDDILELGI